MELQKKELAKQKQVSTSERRTSIANIFTGTFASTAKQQVYQEVVQSENVNTAFSRLSLEGKGLKLTAAKKKSSKQIAEQELSLIEQEIDAHVSSKKKDNIAKQQQQHHPEDLR